MMLIRVFIRLRINKSNGARNGGEGSQKKNNWPISLPADVRACYRIIIIVTHKAYCSIIYTDLSIALEKKKSTKKIDRNSSYSSKCVHNKFNGRRSFRKRDNILCRNFGGIVLAKRNLLGVSKKKNVLVLGR